MKTYMGMATLALLLLSPLEIHAQSQTMEIPVYVTIQGLNNEPCDARWGELYASTINPSVHQSMPLSPYGGWHYLAFPAQPLGRLSFTVWQINGWGIASCRPFANVTAGSIFNIIINWENQSCWIAKLR